MKPEEAEKALADLPAPPLPPALGFGKEAPYTYTVYDVESADALARILNDAAPYAYFYWAALPYFLVVATPNPKAIAQRTAPHIEKGVKWLSESEAIEAAQNLFDGKIDTDYRRKAAFVIGRAYDHGLKLGKEILIDRNQKKGVTEK